MTAMNIFLITMAISVILYILLSIRKGKLSPASSFIWIIFCIILLVLSIWPASIDWLADFLGISYPPTLFITIAIVVLFIINFAQSKKISDLQKKVTDLSQELTILKGKKPKK